MLTVVRRQPMLPTTLRASPFTDFSSPGDLPNPGIELGSPAWWADSLPSEPPGSLPLKSVMRGINGRADL